MGGYGSTRWGWHRKRYTIDDGLRLSVADLRRLGYLQRRAPGWLTWSRGGVDTASAAVSFVAGDLVVMYKTGNRRVECTVPLATVPQPFGGARVYFICPSCGKRRDDLYVAPGAELHGFACRVCHDLTYRSSQEAHHFDRAGGSLGAAFRMMNKYEQLARAREAMYHHREGSQAWYRAVEKYRRLERKAQKTLSEAALFKPGE